MSTVVVAALLAVLALLAFVLDGALSTERLGNGLPPVTAEGTNGASSGLAGPANAAAVDLCQSDVAAVQEAVSQFEVVNQQPPITLSDLAGLLKDSVADPRFTISINPSHPGQVEVSIPNHVAAPGDTNCAYA